MHAPSVTGVARRPLPRPDIALGIVLTLQVLAMLAAASTLGTWQDEEYTLATTAHGVAYAFHRALDYELQAPLYFVVVAALRSFSHSVFAARAFSVVCAVGFAYAMAPIARRIAPAQPPWIVVALVALNPFTIFAALEIRVYALALLLGALGWIAFYDGFFHGTDRRARIAFTTIAIASLYTHYFIAFEFVAFAIGLAVAGRVRALGAYAVCGIVVTLAFVPLLLQLHAQIGSSVVVHDVRLAPPGRVLLHPALDFVFPLDFQIIGGTIARVAAGLGVFAIALAIFFGRPRIDRTIVAYASMALCVQAIYVVLVDGLHYELVAPRHFFALATPEYILALALVGTFAADRARAAALAIAAVLACAALASDVTTYRTGAKAGDWKRVGAYLSRRASPSDTIVIDEPDAVASFRRYYRGTARIVAFPRALPSERYDLDAMIVHSPAEADAAFDALPQHVALWFVDYGVCDSSDRLGCREIHAALARRMRVVERTPFFENTVLRIVPKTTR